MSSHRGRSASSESRPPRSKKSSSKRRVEGSHQRAYRLPPARRVPDMPDWLRAREERTRAVVGVLVVAFVAVVAIWKSFSGSSVAVADVREKIVAEEPVLVEKELVPPPAAAVVDDDRPVERESKGKGNATSTPERRSSVPAPLPPVAPAEPARARDVVVKGSSVHELSDWNGSTGTPPPPPSGRNRYQPLAKTMKTTSNYQPTSAVGPMIDPSFAFPDHLNKAERRRLKVVILSLLEEPEVSPTDHAQELLERGREICRAEPRLYYAMGIRRLREGRSKEAIEHIVEAKDRASGAFFAPWRDYIRLLTFSERYDEAAAEVEEMAREVERRLETGRIPAAQVEVVSQGNVRFLGRVTSFLEQSNGSDYRPATLFVSRNAVVESILQPPRLGIYRDAKRGLAQEFAEQRERDATRTEEINDLEDRMLSTGEKATTTVDSLRTVGRETEGGLSKMGSLSPVMSFAEFGFNPDRNNYAYKQVKRTRSALTTSHTHRVRFEDLEMYRPKRTERFSFYEPMNPVFLAKDLLATIPRESDNPDKGLVSQRD